MEKPTIIVNIITQNIKDILIKNSITIKNYTLINGGIFLDFFY